MQMQRNIIVASNLASESIDNKRCVDEERDGDED